MMKRICVFLLVLVSLVSCSQGDAACQEYFDIWENSGALGMHFEVDAYHLIFAVENDERTLLHEVGHTIPFDFFEFYSAVEIYVQDCEGEFCDYARMYFELGRYHEVYAELYMLNILEGIPEIFEEFYAN